MVNKITMTLACDMLRSAEDRAGMAEQIYNNEEVDIEVKILVMKLIIAVYRLHKDPRILNIFKDLCVRLI